MMRRSAIAGVAAILLTGCSEEWVGVFRVPQPGAPADIEAQVLEIIRSNPEAILESLQAYQLQQQEQAAESQRQVLAELMLPYVDDPGRDVGDSPVRGAENATLILYEFSDFQCPFCARSKAVINEFMAAHGDQVQLVFKHYPLDQIHPEATPAARAAWAAQQQGQFWEYHDALFENADQLSEAVFVEIATALALDLEQFNRDRDSEAAAEAVLADQALGQGLGIQGTPFFILNGQPISGAQPLPVFETALRLAQESLE